MAKHKARWFERPAAYTPWGVVAARAEFCAAVLEMNLSEARQIRMRGRDGSWVREMSDQLGPWWLQRPGAEK